MKVIVRKGFTFIPEYMDNKKAEKKDQVKITFKFLTGADFEEIMAESGADYTMEDQFLKQCEKVEGLIIVEDGKERDAEPKDLMNYAAFFPIYVEAKSAYMKEAVVGEEVKKK